MSCGREVAAGAAGEDAAGAAAAGLGADADCSEVLHRVFEYLDGEMTPDDTAKIRHHLDACTPCLRQYDLDLALKALVKRSCACEPAPVTLRTQIMMRISTIRFEVSD